MFSYIVFNVATAAIAVMGSRDTMEEIMVEAEWHGEHSPGCVFSFGRSSCGDLEENLRLTLAMI